jgi:Protein of unknown function (DUF3551)
MRVVLLTLGTLVAAAAIGTPAQAQNYPWCAIYGGGSIGGGRNCGFWTFEQCLATISGIGGTCQQNTTYRGPASVASSSTNYPPPGPAVRGNWQQRW